MHARAPSAAQIIAAAQLYLPLWALSAHFAPKRRNGFMYTSNNNLCCASIGKTYKFPLALAFPVEKRTGDFLQLQ
jgi:hypothetical protein